MKHPVYDRLPDYFGLAWVFESFCLVEENFASKYDGSHIIFKALVLPIKSPVPERYYIVLKLCFLSICT